MEDLSNYNKLRTDTQKFYNQIGKVFSPVLNRGLHFWSVVPAWVTNKYRDIKLFSTMKGSPEYD